MKTYNAKILDTTKSIKDKTYSKAMDQAKKATNPSPKVLRRGAMISGSVGVVLMIAGLLFRKEKWGLSSLCSGMLVVGVNLYQSKRNATKRNN